MIKNFKAEIVSNKEVNPGIFNLVFKAPELAASAAPGQFLEILCGTDGLENGPFLRRPFGVFNTDVKKGTAEILFKVLGRGTKNLSARKTGEILDIIGPLGNGFKIIEKGHPVIAGGGLGVAPLLLLAKVLREKKQKPVIFLGAKNKDELAAVEKFEKYGKVVLTTDDGSAGEKCFLNIPLEKYLKENKPAVIYCCGPHAMLGCLADLGKKHNIPTQVSLEEKMACGLGVCRGCPVEVKNKDEKYKMVCKDGPVFPAEDIVW